MQDKGLNITAEMQKVQFTLETHSLSTLGDILTPIRFKDQGDIIQIQLRPDSK